MAHPKPPDIVERAEDRLRAVEAHLRCQKEAFQAAIDGAPLELSLNILIQCVQDQTGGLARAAFYIADPKGTCLHPIKLADGMPEAYQRGVDGFPIGPDSLSCGLAIYTGQPIITPDVCEEPLWRPWLHLAQESDFRGCWSFPIHSTAGKAVGTFAMYYREPREATQQELDLASVITQAAGIIISRHTESQERQHAEQALRAFTKELEARVEDRTRDLVDSQMRLRALATELNLAEQRERKRIANELHDHLQQVLVLAKLKVGQGKRLAPMVPASADILQQIDHALADALQYTRTLVTELSPPVLREHGLLAGLKWLAEDMRRHDLTVIVTLPENLELSLAEDQILLIFQSVRELLFNASKYAGTGEATVSLDRVDGKLRVEVCDSGRGFNVSKESNDSPGGELAAKYGLFSIRERMKALGGWFALESAPGKGTRATLVLPCTNARIHTQVCRDSDLSLNAIINGNQLPLEGATRRGNNEISNHMPKVLLVDDHVMVRQGLRSVLEGYADLQVIGEASHGEEAIRLVEQLEPTIVVMDINMPGVNGIEATRWIKAKYPRMIVIGISVNTDDENQTAMKQAGATSLLTKEAAVDELYLAIQTALSGQQTVLASTNHFS